MSLCYPFKNSHKGFMTISRNCTDLTASWTCRFPQPAERTELYITWVLRKEQHTASSYQACSQVVFLCHGSSLRANGMSRHLYPAQLHVILDGYGAVESEFDKMRISKFIFLLQIFYVNEPSVLTSMLNTSFLENSPEGLCLFHTRSTHPVTQHKISSSCCSKGETASSLLPYLTCWVLFIEQPWKSMQLQPSNCLL